MSESEKLDMLRRLSGETDNFVLLTYLNIAAEKVLQKAFPYKRDVKDVPFRYSTTQVEIACYLLNKRGAEGETYHSENGINRSYENADVPDSMLSRIVPYAGVV